MAKLSPKMFVALALLACFAVAVFADENETNETTTMAMTTVMATTTEAANDTNGTGQDGLVAAGAPRALAAGLCAVLVSIFTGLAASEQ
eukprot:CAMPEP_0170226156 /NCGR_PEP_ID=MMETSP0116_2-20130129/12788_1 /TAXON_ID=400756 /ORGANISM="Durinskia baltica, Strain CSIRO CS-38" /LENGTH=88 /DNA_ID=CAMNT_0010476879 /DNA_START=83 /DNA_END=349 /DNA_ORIENTATION=-